MDQTHIHLLITHLPIFGSLLGGIVLAHGLWTKSEQTKIASYNLLIISSIGAGIAYLTGEGAAESVENLPFVLESAIEQHEEFAFIAMISMIILGAASLLGLFMSLTKSPLSKITAIVIFIISLTSFGLVARTGYLGGQIRHTELSTSSSQPAENEEKEADEK